MRKDPAYLESRLRHMHKLAGFDTLRKEYSKKKTIEKNWFQGYHKFCDHDEVNSRFINGKPLSCFTLSGRDKFVFVAVKGAEKGNVAYVTLQYKPSSENKIEAGMHFCLFECELGVTAIPMEDLEITSYAIMLPYIREDHTPRFKQQYTLIYHDWDVLRTDLGDKNYKGSSSVSNSDFCSLISELGI